MKKKMLFLEGKRLYLRPLSLSDVPVLTEYINHPLVRRYLMNLYPKSELAEEAWVRKTMTESNEKHIIFAVVRKQNDTLLGTMGLHGIDYINGTATTGTALGARDEWGKGYAREAKMLVLEYAFHTLGLRKICSAAFADNIGSIRHNLNCGYKVEGRRKKQFFREGRYHDEIILAVFRKDWEKIKNKKTRQ